MNSIRYGFVIGAFVCRWPFLPVRKIIRQNLDGINYLKVLLLNLKRFSFKFGFIKEDHIWVFDDWSDTYFHWTFDVLVKLQAIRSTTLCTQIALPFFLQRNSYVVESLNFLGYRITFLASKKVYLFKKLYVQMNTNYFSVDPLNGIQKMIFSSVSSSISADRIYISRKYALRRHLSNEEKLMDQLQKFGFREVSLEKMSWKEQVLLFEGAEIVVGMHGAGLSNLVYCKRLRLVVEMLPSKNTNKLYEKLSETLSLPYRSCLLDSNLTDPHTAVVEIRDETIRDILQLIRFQN